MQVISKMVGSLSNYQRFNKRYLKYCFEWRDCFLMNIEWRGSPANNTGEVYWIFPGRSPKNCVSVFYRWWKDAECRGKVEKRMDVAVRFSLQLSPHIVPFHFLCLDFHLQISGPKFHIVVWIRLKHTERNTTPRGMNSGPWRWMHTPWGIFELWCLNERF